MMKQSSYLEKSAIELVEEATHILRVKPAKSLLIYYTGTLPFILGLLYFWGDMSRNALASTHLIPGSLLLSVLFIWMKCWHGVFGYHIRSIAGRYEPGAWSLRRIWRLIAAQTIIQPTGILVLPLALLMALPFGWVFAFYQNTSTQGFSKPLRIKTMMNRSFQEAKRWPGQNHILLCIFTLFGFFIFLNVMMAILILPSLLKKLFGVDTLFTLSGPQGIFNTTFLAVACGITYLCMDPLIKAAYALRCFYGAAMVTGEDLKADLKQLRINKKVFAMFIMLAFCLPAAQNLTAAPEPIKQNSPSSGITPENLDASIREVLDRRQFSWRMPREKKSKTESGDFNPFAAFTKWIAPYWKKIQATLAEWMKKIINWLKTLTPKGDIKPVSSSGTGWMTMAQVLFFIFLCIVVCTLVIYLRRLWLKRKTGVSAEPHPLEITPDLSDDYIHAGDLPMDRWLSLAKELTRKGSFRLALRAFYLAILACLADKEMISIAKYKSNRDYASELGRRAHEEKDLIDIFSQTVKQFDTAWYGMKEVTLGDVNLFSSNFNRINAFAKY